jgi:hypothetical protein
MPFEIKKGEPIPTGQHTGLTATMRKLSVGDSFAIDEPGEHTRKGLYAIAKRIGIRITTRKANDALTVWRVADEHISEPPEIKERFELKESIDKDFDFGT